MLSRTDAPRVEHVAHEDASVAHLARVSYAQDDVDGGLQKLVAADNRHSHTLDDIGRILDATVDAFLAALPDAMHVVILEPVDVGTEQSLFDLLKLGLADNCFNLFHTLMINGLNNTFDVHCNDFGGKITTF